MSHTSLLDEVEVRSLQARRDRRGGLLKILMRQHLPKEKQHFGEIYISWAEPGEIKANHYHEQTTEWFCLLAGRARLALVDPASERRRELLLNAEEPVVVTVPPGIAHAFQNVGSVTAHLLAYADRPYDPKDPDTVPYPVLHHE